LVQTDNPKDQTTIPCDEVNIEPKTDVMMPASALGKQFASQNPDPNMLLDNKYYVVRSSGVGLAK
jgi:hypothetical protein